MARKSRKNLPQPEQAAASVLLPELEEAKMPAAIYGRLSVEDEETEESMETQIALVQDYINRSRELSYVDCTQGFINLWPIYSKCGRKSQY